MTLCDMIASFEKDFNPERNLLGARWTSPGYHSRMPTGAWGHQTRMSIYYALALLASGKPEYLERAPRVIRAVLKSQVTDPYDPAYGIWPWFDEEPVAQMAPPDWNWADFIGAALCHMLIEYADRLDAELAREITAALERAAWSIFRRNVQPDYTNIALMGAAVTGCAGEILGQPILCQYAERRLAKFLAYTRNTGGLNEYNSPTYTFVALFEVERLLQLVREPATRNHAEKLFRIFWEELAGRFHPATGQLGGPQSRAYFDYLPPGNADFLRKATGVNIPRVLPEEVEAPLGGFPYTGVRHLPCPPDLAERFSRLPAPEVTTVRRCIRREPDSRSTYATTFLTDELVIGSASVATFWTQCRPLLGYWRRPETAGPAQFRLRVLRDGQDFASAQLYSRQQRNRILFGIGLSCDRGDFHISLDRPRDGVFHFERLTASFELSGAGARIDRGPDGSFRMRLGPVQAVIQPGEGSFLGMPVRWECAVDANGARVEAVLYSGAPRSEAIGPETELTLVGAVELLDAAAAPSTAGLHRDLTPENVTVRWGELELEFPRFAQKGL